MARPTSSTLGTERLVAHLVDGDTTDPLALELVAWLAASPPFRAFVDAHRDKIRKKLRGAADDEARRDVRAELAVGRLLVADRHLDVTFEAYGARNGGPDFTVAPRGEREYNVEVTRIRRPEPGVLARTLMTKLKQLPPSVPNALVVAVATADAATLDVGTAVRDLRARADARDEAFFVTRGYAGRRAFYDRLLRLGAVVAWSEMAEGEARAALWTSPSARIPLPPRAARDLVERLRSS